MQMMYHVYVREGVCACVRVGAWVYVREGVCVREIEGGCVWVDLFYMLID